jgi:hypothetical protein
MNFYTIQNSLNKRIIGHYPQTKSINYNCDVWDDSQFIEHIHFTKIDFEPITANAILHPKSKQTDLIDANSAMGFSKKLLISEKLKEVLERNRKTGMQFFQAPIIHNNIIIENYWVLNMYEINLELIDFQKSKIYETKHTFDLERELKIESYEHFNRVINETNIKGYPFGIIIKEIVLKREHNFDFFALLNVEGGVKYITSTKLKQEIEDAGCTGIEFQPIELSLNEWLQGGEREKVYGKV